MRPKYQIIAADPAWSYNARAPHKPRADGTKKPRFGEGAMGHYPTMTNQDILDLGPMVDAISDDNSLLFLWATMPLLPLACEVIEAWGFQFATAAFVWIKMTEAGNPFTSPGYYTASNAEIVLLGAKGSMPPDVRMINSVILAPRGKHSAKPEEMQDRIDRMYPGRKKLELFARRHRPGWACFGNEIGSKADLRESLPMLFEKTHDRKPTAEDYRKKPKIERLMKAAGIEAPKELILPLKWYEENAALFD
jgi:N6-adenosine-specific RNA methylase IME4